MTLLVFKTDTTGFIQPDRAMSDPSQPRMMRLEMVLFDRNWEEINKFDALIRPDGWVPNAGATAADGITVRRCELYGIRAHAALAVFVDMVRASSEIAAYGMAFHRAIIDRELNLLGGIPDALLRGGMKKTDIMQEASQKWNAGRPYKLEAAFANLGVDSETSKLMQAAHVLRVLRNG